jgi:hypothetical protein
MITTVATDTPFYEYNMVLPWLLMITGCAMNATFDEYRVLILNGVCVGVVLVNRGKICGVY